MNGQARGHRWQPAGEQVEEFRREVLVWFAESGRDLPWRRTRDPYSVLVSEVMLQQTQVSRVLPYYAAFLERFSNTVDLASASTAEVLKLWQGLGYNRRALNLQKAARDVVERLDNQFPCAIADLQSLPGVGAYTARAVACFAFGERVAVVETNVRKSIAYFMDKASGPTEYAPEPIADILLVEDAWTWNQAMIDFGAVRLAGWSAAASDRSTRRAIESPSFESTNRFWRGRIMAALCAYPEPLSLPSLLREMPEGGDEYRVRSLVAALDREGLVNLDAERDLVSLPEE